MSEPGATQFLDLRAYRRKRLIDAARILPILGAGVFLFPPVFLFLAPVSGNRPVAVGSFLFFVWLALIAASFVLSRKLQATAGGD